MPDNNSEQPLAKAEIKALGPHRWKKGESGNPKGSHKGSSHRATLFAASLLSGECEEIVRKTIELAKAGDVGALRICMERLLPPLKSRPINFELPAVGSITDALGALTVLMQAVASGRLLPEQLETLTNPISLFIKAVEVGELETKLLDLEKARKEDEDAAVKERRYDA